MSEQDYQILHETPPGSIRAVVRGFWTLDTLAKFMAEMQQEIARYRARSVPLSILVDALTMKPQSAENGDEAMRAWRGIIDRPGDRAVIIVDSALTTLQFKRLYETDRCRIFDSEKAGRAWLAAARKTTA